MPTEVNAFNENGNFSDTLYILVRQGVIKETGTKVVMADGRIVKLVNPAPSSVQEGADGGFPLCPQLYRSPVRLRP